MNLEKRGDYMLLYYQRRRFRFTAVHSHSKRLPLTFRFVFLISLDQCSPQALLAYRHRYCKRIGRYPLVSQWTQVRFCGELFFFFFSFFPSSFFSPSLFQLDGSIPTRSQFYSYPLFLFFPLWLFFPPFLSSSNRFDAVSAYMRKMDHYGLSDLKKISHIR